MRVEPRRVEKPWGWELIWAETDRYAGKLLFVRAGQALTLQYHERKDGVLVRPGGPGELEIGAVGRGGLRRGDRPGDVLPLHAGTVHRVRALEDTLIVEVSTPQLDDIVRLEDDYGREGTTPNPEQTLRSLRRLRAWNLCIDGL